jgi:hypothetical protein
MMTNTRDKLNEAKYFLEEMKRVFSEPDKFRYTLAAFLAASRSITLIMQNEFSGKDGFKDWYSQKQIEMRNSSVLKYLHRQRNIVHHEHPMLQYPISITGQSFSNTDMQIAVSGTGSNLDLSIGLLSFPAIKPSLSVTYYFDDITNKDKDVIAICQEAINTLEAIVIECESKFN